MTLANYSSSELCPGFSEGSAAHRRLVHPNEKAKRDEQGLKPPGISAGRAWGIFYTCLIPNASEGWLTEGADTSNTHGAG